jgi:single-stranded DNA-binding protein
MNMVFLVGQLARNPVVRVKGRSPLTTFTLAMLEPSRADASFTLYVYCVAWGTAAETASLLHAEDLVRVQGRPCGRRPSDQNDQDQSTMAVNVREVTLLAAAEAVVPTQEPPTGAGRN